MKVIRDSTAAPARQEITCQYCDSDLEIEASDLTYQADPRDGGCWKCDCPVCSRTLWIDERVLTRDVLKQARILRSKGTDG